MRLATERSEPTRFAQTNGICDILHEYAAFKLQLRPAFFVHQRLLLILLLTAVHFLTAEQDHLEQVDFILHLSV
jgi:hypothetical protein